jgi:iron complex outermembrane recepter protein
MKFQRRKVATALGYALGVGGSLLLAALPVSAADVRVDVTGSNIPRTQVETPSPVEIVTREQIQRTGATTINELLNYIPTIDIYNQGEIASNSPSGSGTTNIQLRGLSETNTLVLLNGRRLPVNALYDGSGAGAAVDVNMIPVSAIERVEILRDGGSAIYGADAIAGVVNFITRKDYQGIEVSARYGISSEHDGEEKGASIAAGFGNYERDGYNLLIAGDIFKRDPIFRKDREISKSVDFRRLGALDGRSSFAPQGNFVNPNTGAFTGQSLQPCPPELYNGRCRYDFNASLLTAYNGADRVGGMAVGSFRITPNLKAFAQFSYARAEDHFEAHPVPDFFVVPSGTGLVAGRFMQGGPRITDRKAELWDGNVGLEGNTRWFNWDVAVGSGESKVTNNDKNYYNFDLWLNATENGLIDPTVNTNDPAFVESLKVNPRREGKSKVEFVDLRLRGEAFQLPAGPLGWAVGGSIWKESLSDQPDELTQQGNVVGSIQQAAVDADRRNKAVFAELAIPVLRNLEVQAALRHDRYPTASKTSPKLAALWTPIRQLGVRASYTESFRMPSLKQLFGASDEGAVDVFEDADCLAIGQPIGCEVAAFQVGGSNPNLKPEKGKTWNVGLIADMGPLSGTIDWWRIEKEDEITQPTLSTALSQGLFTRDPVLGRLLIFTNLQNTAESKYEGVDLDLRFRFPRFSWGSIQLRNATTYYIHQRTREVGEEWAEFNGTYALPRWRNTFIVQVETGPFQFDVIGRSVAGFADTDDPWSESEPIPAGTRRVGTHDEWDVSGAYTGFKNTRLRLGVKNVLDRTPPFSVVNAVNNQYEQVGFAPLYSSRGRFFFIDATYSFK